MFKVMFSSILIPRTLPSLYLDLSCLPKSITLFHFIDKFFVNELSIENNFLRKWAIYIISGDFLPK